MSAEVMDGEIVRRWCRLNTEALAQARLWVEVACCDGGPAPLLIGVE
jgi:hypothetical protein